MNLANKINLILTIISVVIFILFSIVITSIILIFHLVKIEMKKN